MRPPEIVTEAPRVLSYRIGRFLFPGLPEQHDAGEAKPPAHVLQTAEIGIR